MEDIKKISIVCSQGAETFEVGMKVKGVTIAKIEQVLGYEDSEGIYSPGWFFVKDKENNLIAKISEIVPYVISFV